MKKMRKEVVGFINNGLEQSEQEKLDLWLREIRARWEGPRIPEYEVNPQQLCHLAIICDGNRRAAVARGLHPHLGHQAGVEVVSGIIRAVRKWGVPCVTFWVWSTENWRREEQQVNFVMRLAASYLSGEEFLQTVCAQKVRVTHLGRKDRLPQEVRRALEELERGTAHFDELRVNIAMDYGGLDEMARAIGKMFAAYQRGEFNPEALKETPQLILEFLDTAGQSLPDLVIRTGCSQGEMPHTSGFMPLQTAYSSWKFLPHLFPNLTPGSLLGAIKEFSNYERRLGR